MSEGSKNFRVNGQTINDAVSLFVSGKVFSGWEDVQITKKLNSLASSFSLTLTDKWLPDRKEIDIIPGLKCHLHIGGQTVIDGYIDTVSLSIDANQRSLQVSGRSKALDLIDSSYDGPSEFSNITMKSLVEKLMEPFSVIPYFLIDGGSFSKIIVKQGETIAEVIDRMCREKSLVVYPTPEGNVYFSQKGSSRSSTEIIQGINMLTGSATHDQTERFSDYTVKAQSIDLGGVPEDSTENTGTAKDLGISRYRPMVVVSENSTNNSGAQERAQYEATLRAAQGSKFNISVQGWLDKEGKVWDVNKMIALRSPFLGYSGDLLIDSVTLSKSNGGTITTMSLIRPDAYEFKKEVEKEEDISKILGGL